MIIRDEVYGNIELTNTESRIIDTLDFQRLRRIKQMSFTYLVYPGATHTRFEHSLGAMYLAGRISEKLHLDKEVISKIRIYGLLHDIGHIAFSHDSEVVVSKYIGDHEEIGRGKISKGEIADIISENYKISEILDIEKSPLSQIVTSDLGADRMDYLLRDSKNTGVAYGIIDYDRIIHKLIIGKELMIDEGGFEAAESLLIARFMMFSTVYLHHTVRVAASMYHRALAYALESDSIEPSLLLSASDDQILDLLAILPESRVYAQGLLRRRLFKEAFTLDYSSNSNINTSKLEKELSEKVSGIVMVEKDQQFFKTINFKVKTSNNVVPIFDYSDIVNSLKKSAEKRRKIRIICPQELREKTQAESKKLFEKN